MSPFTSSERRLLVLAARRFADECTKTAHQLSSSSSTVCECQALAEHASRDLEQLARAQVFDAGREHVERRNGFPDRTWASAALLREVVDSWMTPPWRDGRGSLQRGMWATAALARLGERGLPPDALIRRGLHRRFRVQLTSLVVTARADMAVREEDSPRQPIAPPLLPWIDALASCADQSVNRDTDPVRNLPVRLARALTGQFSDMVESWLANSSIKDIIAWRYRAEPHDGLNEEDLAISGGTGALDWLIDRLERTRLDEWREASLLWELRYLDEPLDTAADAGIPSTLLEERPTHFDPVIQALRRSVRYRMVHDPVLDGLSYSELVDQVTTLIGEGRLMSAVELLEAGVAERPYHQQLRAMLAFCLIPIEPERALGLLNALSVHGTLSDGLLGVNRAAAYLRCGEMAAARSELTDVINGARDSEALLWPLDGLLDRQRTPAMLCDTTTHEWARNVLLQLSNTLDAHESHGVSSAIE